MSETPTRGRPRIARSPVRSDVPHAGGGEIVGRNGEVLSRKRTGTSDPFYLDPKKLDKNWDYQWVAHTVTGNGEVVQDQLLGMIENGWRPVPAGRFPGKFMPAGTSPEAHIIRGGQGLYERPKALSDEARAEELHIARQQMMDRDQSLMGRKALQARMPDGFVAQHNVSYKGRRTGMSIAPDAEIPSPSYELDQGE